MIKLKSLEEILYEDLQDIFYNNYKLTWNQNKSDKDFKDRIQQRTGLSESEFYKIIQKGINYSKLPVNESICLYFIKSKFVLIINTKDKIIITIRDGKWDKPSNSCNKIMVANEDATKLEQFELDFLNEGNFFSMCIDENFNIIIESKCNICLPVPY